MKRFLSGALSVILALTFLVGANPVYADTSYVMPDPDSDDYDAIWDDYDDDYYYEEEEQESEYDRAKNHVIDRWWSTWGVSYDSSSFDLGYDQITVNSHFYRDNTNYVVSWEVENPSGELFNFDGFKIFMSTNYGAYQEIGTVYTNQYYNYSSIGSRYEYELPLSLTDNNPGRYCFIIASFAVRNGVYYCAPNFDTYDTYGDHIYMKEPVVTVYKNKIKINWQAVPGAQYYGVYNPKTHNYDIVYTNSYTIKNIDTQKDNYMLNVKAYANGYEITEANYFSTAQEGARFRAAKKLKKKKTSIPVVNTRTKKTTKAWTMALTNKDKQTLKKWTKKHFKKGMSDYDKAMYALTWINEKVTYAEGAQYNKIAQSTYVDAIFNKKLGQCLQYNGAAAAILAYMGYDVRIVQGWRGYSMKNKWSHYWCEIKIDGNWYLVEAGNHMDGLSPHLATPYSQSRGYMLNQKPVGNSNRNSSYYMF